MDCWMKAIAFFAPSEITPDDVDPEVVPLSSWGNRELFLCGIYSSLQSLMMTAAEQSANSPTYSAEAAHTSSRAHATPAESTAAAEAAKGTSHPETVVNIGPANNHRRRFNS
jgi:hypothetical protein